MNSVKRGIFINIDLLLSYCGSISSCFYGDLFSALNTLAKDGFSGDGPVVHLCSAGCKEAVALLANLCGIVDAWHVAEGGAVLFNPTTGETKTNSRITDRTRSVIRRVGRKIVPRLLRRYEFLSLRLGNQHRIVLEKAPHSMVDEKTVVNEIRRQLRRSHRPKKATKIILGGLRNPFRRHRLSAKEARERLLHVTYGVSFGKYAITIAPASADMASAVMQIAEFEQTDLSRSIAVGFSSDDRSLFSSVGLVGCPNDASDECKMLVGKRRGRVSSKSNASAVIDIVKYFLFGVDALD